MKGLGVMSDDVSFLSKLVRDSMESQAQEALKNTKEDTMESLQVHRTNLSTDPSFMIYFLETCSYFICTSFPDMS
jgi:hypothetical protein